MGSLSTPKQTEELLIHISNMDEEDTESESHTREVSPFPTGAHGATMHRRVKRLADPIAGTLNRLESDPANIRSRENRKRGLRLDLRELNELQHQLHSCSESEELDEDDFPRVSSEHRPSFSESLQFMRREPSLTVERLREFSKSEKCVQLSEKKFAPESSPTAEDLDRLLTTNRRRHITPRSKNATLARPRSPTYHYRAQRSPRASRSPRVGDDAGFEFRSNFPSARSHGRSSIIADHQPCSPQALVELYAMDPLESFSNISSKDSPMRDFSFPIARSTNNTLCPISEFERQDSLISDDMDVIVLKSSTTGNLFHPEARERPESPKSALSEREDDVRRALSNLSILAPVSNSDQHSDIEETETRDFDLDSPALTIQSGAMSPKRRGSWHNMPNFDTAYTEVDMSDFATEPAKQQQRSDSLRSDTLEICNVVFESVPRFSQQSYAQQPEDNFLKFEIEDFEDDVFSCFDTCRFWFNDLYYRYPRFFTGVRLLIYVLRNIIFFTEIVFDSFLLHILAPRVPFAWVGCLLCFMVSPWIVLWGICGSHVTEIYSGKAFHCTRKNSWMARAEYWHQLLYLCFPTGLALLVAMKLWFIFKDCYNLLRFIVKGFLPPYHSKDRSTFDNVFTVVVLLTHSLPQLVLKVVMYFCVLRTAPAAMKNALWVSICLTTFNFFLNVVRIHSEAATEKFEDLIIFMFVLLTDNFHFVRGLYRVKKGWTNVVNLVGTKLTPVKVFTILENIQNRNKELTFLLNHENFTNNCGSLYNYFWDEMTKKSEMVYFLTVQNQSDLAEWFKSKDKNQSGDLSKSECPEVFEWWRKQVGPRKSIPMFGVYESLWTSDTVVRDLFEHPFELDDKQKAKFGSSSEIFEHIYADALSGLGVEQQRYIESLKPNEVVGGLEKKNSLHLLLKKDEWDYLYIVESILMFDFIMEFPQLQRLHIYNCTIKEPYYPCVLCHRNLQELCVEDTNLQSLSRICNLKRLEILCLRKCVDMAPFHETIDLPRLKHLEITKETRFIHLKSVQTLKTLEKLIIRDCDELSTEGVDTLNLPSLRYINLSNSSFDRLCILSKLKKLERLSLVGCKNLTSVGCDRLDLPQLKRFDAKESNFDKLSIITNLWKLEKLNLEKCEQLNTEGCQPFDLPMLLELHLYGSNFDNLWLLQNLKKLQKLTLLWCKNLDTFCCKLLHLPMLRELDLRSSNFDRISILSGLNIEQLNLANCKNINTADCDALYLPQLKKFDLYGSNFDRLAILRKLRKLEKLDMEACIELDTSDCGVLELPELVELNLPNSNFDRLCILERLTKLERLNAERCEQLSTKRCPKLNLENLKFVFLSESNFDRLRVFSRCKKLEMLVANDCPNLCTQGIRRLGLPNLTEINFRNSSFERFSVLDGLQKLEKLNLSDCPKLTTEGLDKPLNLPNLKHLYLSSSSFDKFVLLKKLNKLERLNVTNCPKLTVDNFNIGDLPDSLKRLSYDEHLHQNLDANFTRRISILHNAANMDF